MLMQLRRLITTIQGEIYLAASVCALAWLRDSIEPG